MRTKFLSALAFFISAALFTAAAFVLYKELQHHTFAEIKAAMQAIPPGRLALALLASAIGYIVIIGYDALAIHFVRKTLPYLQIGVASFVGHVMGINLGASTITGSSVRFRFYAGKGLTTVETLRVVGFCTVTFWLGFSTTSSIVFLFFPPPIPEFLHLPFTSSRPLGFLFLVTLIAYLNVSRKQRHDDTSVFCLPTLRLSLMQIAVASTEWVLAAAILYFALPATPDLSFIQLLGIFLLAQFAGQVSQIPGGLGIFETVILHLLPPSIPVASTLGSLLVFRAAYNLIPLAFALVMLAVHEIYHRKHHFARLGSALQETTKSISGSVSIPSAFSSVSNTLRGNAVRKDTLTPALHVKAMTEKERETVV